LVLTSE